MRWILVFLFLYLIPLIVLFSNYNNFKRSFIYSSIYIVLVSTIVITNIYMSGLNKIKEAMYYQSYVFDERYKDRYASNFDTSYEPQEKNKQKKEIKLDNSNDTYIEDKATDIVEESSSKEVQNKVVIKEKTDQELIVEFKKEIYNVETIALVPMRDCMPYTKNISENIKNLNSILEDIKYAKKMCREVISIYSNIEIPSLSNKEYTHVLNNARDDVKKAYELREKAMESAIELIKSKNPKHIGKITRYLNLSDEHIASFKERISDLNDKIK